MWKLSNFYEHSIILYTFLLKFYSFRVIRPLEASKFCYGPKDSVVDSFH